MSGDRKIGFTTEELLHMPPESAEEAYRRGYRDGWLKCREAFHECQSGGFSRQEALDLTDEYIFGPLQDWQDRGEQEGASGADWPPDFTVPERREYRKSRKGVTHGNRVQGTR